MRIVVTKQSQLAGPHNSFLNGIDNIELRAPIHDIYLLPFYSCLRSWTFITVLLLGSASSHTGAAQSTRGYYVGTGWKWARKATAFSIGTVDGQLTVMSMQPVASCVYKNLSNKVKYY